MTSEALMEALGSVRDDYVQDAHSERRTGRRPRWAALAACLCLILLGAYVAPRLLGNVPPPEPAPPVSDPGTVGPADPLDLPPEQTAEWEVVYNEVAALPTVANGVSLTARPVTEAELAAVLPEAPLHGKVENAYATYYGMSDENGRILGSGELEGLHLTLAVPEGEQLTLEIRPRKPHYDEVIDPAAYETTSFAAGDVILCRCGAAVWTEFTSGGVWYTVTAWGEQATEAFPALVNDLLLWVETPELSRLPANP